MNFFFSLQNFTKSFFQEQKNGGKASVHQVLIMTRKVWGFPNESFKVQLLNILVGFFYHVPEAVIAAVSTASLVCGSVLRCGRGAGLEW